MAYGKTKAAVFGASGGIGAIFVDQLAAQGFSQVFAISRGGDTPARDAVTPLACDPLDEAALEATADAVGGDVDLCIVAIGMLHGDDIEPEKTWRHLDADAMARVYAVNTIAPTMIAKHMLPRLRKGPSVFAALSARVGSISDNRIGGWLSYRASKAALNQSIRTLSIELARRNGDAAIVGLHPGTVDTGLSKPFQGNVPDGKLFTPDHSVAQMLGVLDDLPKDASGNLFAYDGEIISP